MKNNNVKVKVKFFDVNSFIFSSIIIGVLGLVCYSEAKEVVALQKENAELKKGE